MLISKKALSIKSNSLQLVRLINVSFFSLKTHCLNQNPSIRLISTQKFNFTSSANLVQNLSFQKKQASLEDIKKEIEHLTLKISQKQQIRDLQKIVYPEALLHGEQNIFKLTKLYDSLIDQLEVKDLEHKHFDHLIKAGDFYYGIRSRRLRALKPYLKAKQQIKSQNIEMENQEIYQQLCSRINSLIQEEIHQGECQKIDHYYKEAIQQQKNGHQLQAIYYYYKGICISEFQQIPDKLLHYEMLARYTHLAQLRRPNNNKYKTDQHYQQLVEKYDELLVLGNKWWNQEFTNSRDTNRKNKFQRLQSWVLSNKANMFYKSNQYEEAIHSYQKAMQIYKKTQHKDIRLKIVGDIQNLYRSYLNLGQKNKAISFLEWGHDFIKQEVLAHPMLTSKYLRPIKQMLIQFYKKNAEMDKSFPNKLEKIQAQLKQITK